MRIGDHIYFNCGGYNHHGIDCGDGTVVHYTKNQGNISRVSWDSFASGKIVFVREYGSSDFPDVVIQRAESRLGENTYDVFGNNCDTLLHGVRQVYTQANKSKMLEQRQKEHLEVEQQLQAVLVLSVLPEPGLCQVWLQLVELLVGELLQVLAHLVWLLLL